MDYFESVNETIGEFGKKCKFVCKVSENPLTLSPIFLSWTKKRQHMKY